MRDAAPRPKGIAVLSWVHMVLGALAAVGALITFWAVLDGPGQGTWAGMAKGVVLAGLFLSSGIGMWRGKKSGWVLGTFCYAYVAIADLFELSTAPAGARGLCLLLAAVYVALYVYLFRPGVLVHFGLGSLPVWKPVMAEVATGFVLAGIFSLLPAVPDPVEEPPVAQWEQQLEAGEYDAVLRGTSRHLVRNPTSARMWCLQGWAHLGLEQLSEAESCFRTALAADAAMDDALLGLGMTWQKRGETDLARATYERAARILPKNEEPLVCLLIIEMMAGDYEKAAAYGEKAWALNRTRVSIAANLAIASHHLGNIEKRDEYYGHAERLGYADLDKLKKVFEEEKPESRNPKSQ